MYVSITHDLIFLFKVRIWFSFGFNAYLFADRWTGGNNNTKMLQLLLVCFLQSSCCFFIIIYVVVYIYLFCAFHCFTHHHLIHHTWGIIGGRVRYQVPCLMVFGIIIRFPYYRYYTGTGTIYSLITYNIPCPNRTGDWRNIITNIFFV